MMKLSIVGAVAIAASLAAIPTVTQAAGCALYDPNCATYPMPKNDAAGDHAVRSERTGRMERHAAVREQGDVVGGAVGAAVGTAGAIATAPFRAADSYAYYNDDEGSGWPQQSYAERNGFVCTPGTLFRGFDGRMHPCQ